MTGAGIATYDQGVIISQHLVWVEIATVLAIALIVGFFFLSIGAAVATLACAATAFLIAIRVVAWVMQQMHVTLPPDVEPVLVVLLLGVTTDYSVFFASGMRNRLAEGMSKVQAARLTTAEYAPIIFAAGLLVAAGTASLGRRPDAADPRFRASARSDGPDGHGRIADTRSGADRHLRQRPVLARATLVPQVQESSPPRC